MQVMLVEDNAMLAAAVAKALRTAGFSVNHVSRGDQVLSALKSAKPDILVLDLATTTSPSPSRWTSCWPVCVRWSVDWAA